MELYMCGFNAHQQLHLDEENPRDDITQFHKVHRSPHLGVRCALWSSTVVESDGKLIHSGFRRPRSGPIPVDGPPTRNIKTIFGDTSGVLGALTTDGSLCVYHDDSHPTKCPEFKKHRFAEDSFIAKQNLAIEHLAIADSGEVCIITSTYA